MHNLEKRYGLWSQGFNLMNLSGRLHKKKAKGLFK